MAKKTEADVALEMYESVKQSKNKRKRLKSSTFWGLFKVKARKNAVVERIERIIDQQGLRIAVKSGATFGEESGADWIILTLRLPPESTPPWPPILPREWPSAEWFEMMQTRLFESEREVEAYFIAPLLENLGYDYDDIVIGYSVEMFKGVRKTRTEADFVVFNGPSREKEDVLLVIEAKKSDKGISVDHIGQAKSYAQELLPACYIVSNGQQIIVFQFNGMLAPDERVLDFDRVQLRGRWKDLYNYTCKEATIRRKQWMEDIFQE
ncbi:MAG: type I restriction enzyme HsdR N-terminal domain-containing protein [Chloroflexi bacterium]|nr:type I restriction enzyme HsdR N-terminal domain-containing protein [Chloroflexota bacterium]